MKTDRVMHCLLYLLLVVSSRDVRSQSMLGGDTGVPEIMRPSIGAGFSFVPRSNFSDGLNTFKLTTRYMGAAIPIYERIVPEGPDKGFVGILMHGSASVIVPQISFSAEQHRLTAVTLGMTATFLTSERNMYVLTLNGGFAEDRINLTETEFRLSGSGIGTWRAIEGTTILFGASYSYNFDRGVLLPILGVRGRIGEGWSYSVLFPVVLRVRYRYDREWIFAWVIRPSGNRFHASNEGMFPNAPETVDMRIFQIQAGMEAQYRVYRHVVVQGELGVLGGRRLIWSSEDKNLKTASIAGSGYLTLGVRFFLDAADVENSTTDVIGN